MQLVLLTPLRKNYSYFYKSTVCILGLYQTKKYDMRKRQKLDFNNLGYCVWRSVAIQDNVVIWKSISYIL